MVNIIICSQCGTQTEAHKKFCPNCGAPISNVQAPSTKAAAHATQSNSRSRPTASKVPVSNVQASATDAASTLFTTLQQRKQETNSETVAESKTASTPEPGATVQKKEARPKTFAKRPLGVAKPETAASTKKQSTLSKEEKTQLIEFLRGLNRLDRFLEASAVVKKDGTLLASAHSTRAKPEMMSTISSTLFGIAEDSIRAISGGKMRIVTIIAEQCVLMLSPINEDTCLLLITSPKSNLGLLLTQSEFVSQNIAKFLAAFA